MYNPFSLNGKVVLVTGASSGIGKSIAIECSKLGAEIVITARNPKRLSETFSELKGTNHLQFVSDLSDTNSIDELINYLPELDGIVHVAGIVNPKPFSFITRKYIDEIMDINFYGPALLSNGILRRKILKKNSSIVFISSISGVNCSFVGGSIYSASKGALNGLIKGMALDLASKQIRVNSIIPGVIDTGIFKDSAISEEDLINDRKRYPLGSHGKPEDIAFATVYLVSDASSWVTGSNLLIDGGFTLL